MKRLMTELWSIPYFQRLLDTEQLNEIKKHRRLTLNFHIVEEEGFNDLKNLIESLNSNVDVYQVDYELGEVSLLFAKFDNNMKQWMISRFVDPGKAMNPKEMAEFTFSTSTPASFFAELRKMTETYGLKYEFLGDYHSRSRSVRMRADVFNIYQIAGMTRATYSMLRGPKLSK